ncbi:hypothetical protein FS749_000845 [Ceratobasidium sp. UAMH 11750]|nr:hypothetical protein FS749_000845 [Ceratobasidium sp. UAMH 11750]
MSPASRSRRLAWHYWISALRLIAGAVALPACALVLTADLSFGPLVFVPWLLVMITDLLLLTVDLWRTSIFSTSFFAQLVFPSLATIGFVTFSVLLIRIPQTSWKPTLLVVVPHILGALYSIGLCISLSLAFRNARTRELDVRWTVNGKDLIMGTIDISLRTSLLGARRPTNLCAHVFPTRKGIARFIAALGAYGVKVVLRRVSPVESKKYALVRNLFALCAVGAIVFRAVTLLAQAQSEVFETKTRIEDCEQDWRDRLLMKDMKILVRYYGDRNKQRLATAHQNFSLTINVMNARGLFVNCLWNSYSTQLATTNSDTDWFSVASCFQENDPTQADLLVQEVVYNLTLTFRNTSSFPLLRAPQMWFTYAPSGSNPNRNTPSLIPWLVPSWQLVPGLHLEAEAAMAKRNFITSTFFRDVIGGAKPVYETVPMFPITTTRFASINNSSVVTGAIRPAPQPVFSPSSARKEIQGLLTSPTPMPITCEVVEDYRSSTALDALGSVGGLFAILQGLHLLLFGRPLFWGIAGAKLISPFGLLGGLSSKSFRKRLQDHYRVPPSTSEPRDDDTIRITSFLKDFVIDFGPADAEETGPCRPTDCTTNHVGNGKDTEPGDRIELLPALSFQPLHTSDKRPDTQGRASID